MKLRTMRKALLLTMFVCLSSYLVAQKYSNEFLSIGAGARGQAMGNAQVAIADDNTAGYWNPAGLLGIKEDMQIGFLHSEWFAGISKYDYLSIAGPLKQKENEELKRALGFSFIRFGTDDIPNTLHLIEDDGTINYDNIRPFSAADYAFIFSYSQQIFDKLDAGANFKVIHRKVGPFAAAWGFGLDIGGQYHLNKNVSFGLMLKDITSTFNAWNFNFTEEEKEELTITGNEVPLNSIEITKPQIILGAAYGKDFILGKQKRISTEAEGPGNRTVGILASVDFQVTTDGKRNALISGNPFSVNPALGVELDYNKLVYLRGGISNFQRSSDILGKEFLAMQPSAGIGLKLWQVQLDYTFTNVGDQQEKLYSHVISLRVNVDFEFFRDQFKNANL